MDLPDIADHLGAWQVDPWPGHLHPGDLGWHTLAGASHTAQDLRIWLHDGSPVAIGLLDDGVLRMALDPSVTGDEGLAEQIARGLSDPGPPLFSDGDAVVEARGSDALRARLRGEGWQDDDAWTSFCCDLSEPLDFSQLDRTGLRVEKVGLEAAEVWTGVHWSAFRGADGSDDARDRIVRRWSAMMTGPLADHATSLLGYDSAGAPVAVATVWTAGRDRPGLIEPLGVHADHQGQGYGRAITVAAARALQDAGASSANVATENSRHGAIATYRSAGFRSLGSVADLRRA